ncbi:Remorin [Capsicum annuum]|nr:Remorin [Capsicum annuum]
MQSPIQTNVHTQFDDPTSDVNAHLTQYNTFFDMNAPQYIMPSNMSTQFSILDLNETLNESDRGLTLRDTNNVDLFENDYNYDQSSQLGWMHNAGTSVNVHLSLSLDTVDYYRNNVKRGEHIITDAIENGDQSKCGELSQGDDSEPNNAEGGECSYESSSSGDDVRSNSEQRAMSMSPYPQQESILQSVSVSVPINRPHFYYNEISFLNHFQERSNVFMNMHEGAFKKPMAELEAKKVETEQVADPTPAAPAAPEPEPAEPSKEVVADEKAIVAPALPPPEEDREKEKEKTDDSKALVVVEDKAPEPADEKKEGSIDRDAVLARVATEKRLSLIKAWEESEKSKAENKAQKKVSAIAAWENSKKANLEAELKKMEEQLETKKAQYTEKMKNKIALLHKEAEEKRAVIEAKRGEDLLKAEELAAKYRATGTAPKKILGLF